MLSARNRAVVFVALCVATIGASPAMAQPQAVAFDSDAWNITNEAAEMREYLGQSCLHIPSGAAMLKDVMLRDGIIEFDVSSTNPRGFVGINFRMQTPRDNEYIYLRVHKSGSSDALQYTPVYNGMAAWQLFNGEGYTAPTRFTKSEWTHLKIEVRGDQARVYVNGAAEPSLHVTDLERDYEAGGIAVRANFGVCVANFRYEAYTTTEQVAQADKTAPEGFITEWELSPAFSPEGIDTQAYPKAAIKWESVTSSASGLVNVSEYHVRPQGGGVIYARTSITSTQAQRKKLLLGYSDIVSVFLNGNLLFSGQSAFQSRDQLFQGIIGLHDALMLDLQEGENELLFVVSEIFGGWGFMGKVEDVSGLTLNQMASN